jgi:hypothetical protein
VRGIAGMTDKKKKKRLKTKRIKGKKEEECKQRK